MFYIVLVIAVLYSAATIKSAIANTKKIPKAFDSQKSK